MMNRDLLIRSLNYHGQQLTSFLQNTSPKLLETNDVKHIDYHLYLSRSKELRMEDRGKRLLLHRFIAQNVEGVFGLNHDEVSRPAPLKPWEKPPGQVDLNDIPPLDTFLTSSVPTQARAVHFFDLIGPEDIVYCRIGARNTSGLLLTVEGFHPFSGKSRFCPDLSVKCFCPAEEMAPTTSSVKSYANGDYVCVVILEVKRDAQRLLVR